MSRILDRIAGRGRLVQRRRNRRRGGALLASRTRMAAALGGCLALALGLAFALPAGAKTEFVLQSGGGGGASMTIKPVTIGSGVTVEAPVTIKAGPVTFTGNAAPARLPGYVSNVGHFVVNGTGGGSGAAQPPLAVPVGGVVYLCPPFAAPARNLYGYASGAPVYGAAGYGVPRYDYRAAGSTRASSAYYRALELNRRALERAPRPQTPGAFNRPSADDFAADTAERESFEPLFVQLSGKDQSAGKLPLVHRPAGKSFIRIE